MTFIKILIDRSDMTITNDAVSINDKRFWNTIHSVINSRSSIHIQRHM